MAPARPPCTMPIKPDDPVLPLRRQLAAEIARSLGPMAQYGLAPAFGIRQPRMSELERGVVVRCTVEWLIRRIYRMGGSVRIEVTLGDVARKRARAAANEWRKRHGLPPLPPDLRPDIAPVRPLR